MGTSVSYLLLKSSLSNILATVVELDNLITSEKLISFNHLELYTTLSVSIFKTAPAWSKYVLALSRASSMVSCGLVLFLPVGSPIIAVKSPITRTA